MAGFREFVTGEVLTAANVNGFLMKQSVMVFADDAARTAALGAEVTEGMLTFNKDTGQLEVFDGTNFVVAAPPQNLVEVKSALFTGTQSTSTAAQGNSAVTGLDITHAVADASHEVYLFAQVMTTKFDGTTSWGGAAITAGGVLLNLGDADGVRTRVAGAQGNGFDALPNTVGLLAKHSPGVTTSVTYGVSVINIDSVTRTLHVNRANSDTNVNTRIRGASVLILAEVRV